MITGRRPKRDLPESRYSDFRFGLRIHQICPSNLNLPLKSHSREATMDRSCVSPSRSLRATPIVTAVAILRARALHAPTPPSSPLSTACCLRTAAVPNPGRQVVRGLVQPRRQPTRAGGSIPAGGKEIRGVRNCFRQARRMGVCPSHLAAGGETQFRRTVSGDGILFPDTRASAPLLGRTLFSEDDDHPGGGAAGPVMVIS